MAGTLARRAGALTTKTTGKKSGLAATNGSKKTPSATKKAASANSKAGGEDESAAAAKATAGSVSKDTAKTTGAKVTKTLGRSGGLTKKPLAGSKGKGTRAEGGKTEAPAPRAAAGLNSKQVISRSTGGAGKAKGSASSTVGNAKPAEKASTVSSKRKSGELSKLSKRSSASSVGSSGGKEGAVAKKTPGKAKSASPSPSKSAHHRAPLSTANAHLRASRLQDDGAVGRDSLEVWSQQKKGDGQSTRTVKRPASTKRTSKSKLTPLDDDYDASKSSSDATESAAAETASPSSDGGVSSEELLGVPDAHEMDAVRALAQSPSHDHSPLRVKRLSRDFGSHPPAGRKSPSLNAVSDSSRGDSDGSSTTLTPPTSPFSAVSASDSPRRSRTRSPLLQRSEEDLQEEASELLQEFLYNNEDVHDGEEPLVSLVFDEIRKPEKHLARRQISGVIPFLGTDRAVSDADAQAQLSYARRDFIGAVDRAERASEEEAIDEGDDGRDAARSASTTRTLKELYAAAQELARRITAWSAKARQDDRNAKIAIVASDGEGGIAEAACRGAAAVESLPLSLSCCRVDEFGEQATINRFANRSLTFSFTSDHSQSLWLSRQCCGMVLFPCGFSGLRLALDVMGRVAARSSGQAVPIVFFGRAYWEYAFSMDMLLTEMGFSDEPVAMNKLVTDDIDEAFAFLVRGAKPIISSRTLKENE